MFDDLDLTPEQRATLRELNIVEAAHLAALLQEPGTCATVTDALGLDDAGLTALREGLEALGLDTGPRAPGALPPMGCLDGDRTPDDG
jgi:hypothetical protein